MALKILIVYAREDESFTNELLGQLVPFKRRGEKVLWEERLLEVGGDWRGQIQDTLEICAAVCLLVSPVFLASNFIQSVEWKRFLERSNRDGVLIVLIKLHPCELPIANVTDCLVFPEGGGDYYSLMWKEGVVLSYAQKLAQWIEEHVNSQPLTIGQKQLLKIMQVGLTNFRCYKKVEIQLDPFLNVFVGNNGAGKSAILDAIAICLDVIVNFYLDSSQQTLKKKDILLGHDGKQAFFANIAVTTFDHLTWSLFEKSGPSRMTTDENYGVSRLSELHDTLKEMVAADKRGKEVEIPVLVYYGIRRDHYERDSLETAMKAESRFESLRGACRGTTDYKSALQWFNFQEGKELRQQNKRKDFAFRLPELEAVRRAISSMITGVSNPRTEDHPEVLLVDWEMGGIVNTVSFSQLSDGYRSMLALVMDLAQRMAQANPHLDEPLHANAVVLIDEIDLHLHPKWQQTVLLDLRRTFPQAQFIVTTHSPQVLTTVEPEQIQCIDWDGEEVEFWHPRSSYGAESGRLLQDILGVDPRPPDVESTPLLKEYFALIDKGQGQGSEAVGIRQKLDNWANGEEPDLVRADMEIRRQERFGR